MRRLHTVSRAALIFLFPFQPLRTALLYSLLGIAWFNALQAHADDERELVQVFAQWQRPATPLPSAVGGAQERRQALPVQHTRDGYEDAKRWCEQPVLRACATEADCAAVVLPGGGRTHCAKPYWAKDDQTKVCAAKWPSRREREWREARLHEIVGEICSGARCRPSQLGAFLALVATRESTLRPWKAHRLNGDVRANRVAWMLKAKRYGHEHVVEKKKGREVIVGVKLRKGGNRYYADEMRWQGYGLFGQNSPLFVYLWDPEAPPEVLCREVEAVATYTERARVAATKQRNLGITPTWATVHAALAAGEVRPSPGAIERFRKQARRTELDPDAVVTPGSFGRSLGSTVPARRLAAELLRVRVNAKHPWPPARAGA